MGGGIIAKGGNVDDQNLEKLIGYSATGYFERESISGTYISDGEVMDSMLAQVAHLAEATNILDGGAYGSWMQSAISANRGAITPIIKDVITIGGKRIPLTLNRYVAKI